IAVFISEILHHLTARRQSLFSENRLRDLAEGPVHMGAVVFKGTKAGQVSLQVGMLRNSGILHGLDTVVMIMERLGNDIFLLRIESTADGRVQVAAVRLPRFLKAHVAKLGVPGT